MEVDKALREKQEYTDLFTDYIDILRSRSDSDKLNELAEKRRIRLETLEEHGIFYIKNMAEMLVPKYMKHLESFGIISNTNKKPIYHDRWIIPIKDMDGKVLGLVGYSKDAKERYVYSTSRYYDRLNTFYGLENMPNAYEDGYAILTEGITDTLAIRDIGYKNTFAYCGTRESEYKRRVLNRLRHGVINVHDRDRAGDATKERWKTNRYFTFITPIGFKDSSDTLSEGNGMYKEWFTSCMDATIEWIKSAEHNGLKCPSEEATML